MTRQRAKFGELFRIKHGFAFRSQFFETAGPYVLLTPGNFNEGGGFRDAGEKQKYYTGEVPEGFILDQADVLIAMTEQAEGLLGSSVWIPEPGKYLHNQRLGRVVDLDQARLDKRYLYYLFNTREVRQQIRAGASGTKVRHTAPERIGRVEVDLPPISAQRRVAEALLAYDSLIENNRRRMALSEQAARLLYQEWFVRLRFPGRERARVFDGVPEGWRRRPLAEIVDVNRTTLPNNFDEEIQYLDIGSVERGQIRETTTYMFRDAPSRARRVVKHGDVIWSCVRPNRRSYALIWEPARNLIVSTGFAVLTPTLAPPAFVYFATTTDEFVGYLENRARGAAYPAVLATDFERAEILVPPKQLLDALDGFAEPSLSQMSNLDRQNQKLRAARDLLLPRLMSGDITV